MTVAEIELACSEARGLNSRRHPLESPPPRRRRLFYPFGFPVEVRTDSEDVFEIYQQMWGMFTARFAVTPLVCEVYVQHSTDTTCPPAPSYRIQMPLLLTTANADNFSVVQLRSGFTRVTLSSAALCHRLYAAYFLLSSPLTALSASRATAVHAACVSRSQHGVLLCGDSGAGKSTLAYACARRGWTYTSDDASYLVPGEEPRTVTGDCYRVRFRPQAASLFPEINQLTMTPRATGKPSAEMLTLSNPRISIAPTSRVDYIVFVNRAAGAEQQLRSYSRDVFRLYLRQTLIGTRAQVRRQLMQFDTLLEVPVLELRYSELPWAVERLNRLVEEGMDDVAVAAD